MASDEAINVYPGDPWTAPSVTLKLQEAFDRGRESTRPGEHEHEFEDCCVICGKTWHNVQKEAPGVE